MEYRQLPHEDEKKTFRVIGLGTDSQLMIDVAIGRIRRMELCFDALQKAAKENAPGILENALFQEFLRILTQYYESGQWLRDYELDEQGLLPHNLKRGVLAQDAVYDFLDGINRVDRQE